jgi:pSer/pThr/pTyr-binding forkhead associated (FHA) protein
MAQLTLLPRKPRSDAHKARNDRQPSSPMRLVLSVMDSRQVISTQLREQLVVGRGSGNTDIDLAALDTGNFGISREHALFLYTDGALFVEDLNSTNGTRINGYQIDAGKQYILHNGDEVEFGSLRLMVRLVRAPY